MTDNTNIEALPELPGPGLTHAGECVERGHWYSADQMREYGLLCHRSALSNTGPVDASTPEAKGNIAAWLRRRASNDLVMIPGRLAGQIADHIDSLSPSVPAPLSDEKISEIAGSIPWGEDDYDGDEWDRLLVRAIEAAHGIKEKAE